jgi:hypothetical protein
MPTETDDNSNIPTFSRTRPAMHVFLDDFEICNLPNSGQRHEKANLRPHLGAYKEKIIDQNRINSHVDIQS